MSRLRKNPFKAKIMPDEFEGRPMGGTYTHPGFHTSDEIEYVFPYANEKADINPWTKGVIKDYPVILEFDMLGLEYYEDYDAKLAWEEVETYLKYTPGASIDEIIDEIFQVGEEEDSRDLLQLDTGDSGTQILFSKAGAHISPIMQFADWFAGKDGDVVFGHSDDCHITDPNKHYRKCTCARIRPTSAQKAEMFHQFRYLDDIEDVRLVAVHYMKPVWSMFDSVEYTHDEYDIETMLLHLDKLGIMAYTLDDFPYDANPIVTEVWRSKTVYTPQYHGTSYKNLLKACPWIKNELPRPPLPYGIEINDD